jgi:hypothetical protein
VLYSPSSQRENDGRTEDRMRNLLPLALTLVSLFVAPLLTRQGEPKVIEDKDYCFKLTVPEKGWQLLDEREIRRLSPDAVAGGMTQTGVFGFVIVEPLPNMTLQGLKDLVLENTSIEDRSVSEAREIRFQDEPALRFQVSGTIAGNALKWDYVLVVRSGFAYQLVAGGPKHVARWSLDRLTPFHAAFSFTEGTPRVRIVTTATPDRVDVGWEIRGGVFQSAIFGVRAAPARPWRLIVGDELQQVSAESHVGFEFPDPSIYAVLTFQTVGADEVEAAIAEQTSGYSLEMGKETLPVKLFGREMELAQGSASAAPRFEYMIGATSFDTTVVSVLAWYVRESAEVARPRIAEVLATVGVLDDTSRTELLERLSAQPDAQNEVGRWFCLRRGVYQDFAGGFRWTKPRGFWRVLTDAKARAEAEDCSVAFHDDAAGLSGYVTVLEVEDPDIEVYFDAMARALFGDDYAEVGERRKVDLGEVEGLTIGGKATDDPTYLDVTVAVTKNRVIHLTLGCTLSQSQRAREKIDAARGGLHVLEKVPPRSVESDGLLRDERLGFSLRSPGPGWKRTYPPVGGNAQASSAGWSKDGQEISVVALCPALPTQETQPLVDLISKLVEGTLKKAARKTLVRGTQDFMGAPRDHLSWKDGAKHGEVFFVVRDRTCYAVSLESSGERFDRAVAERCVTILP